MQLIRVGLDNKILNSIEALRKFFGHFAERGVLRSPTLSPIPLYGVGTGMGKTNFATAHYLAHVQANARKAGERSSTHALRPPPTTAANIMAPGVPIA